MVYRGIVSKGTVVLEGNPALPEGAEVRLEVVEDHALRVEDDPIYRIGELALPTGVPDLAKNIDHYLYGHPKNSKDQQ